MDRHAVHHIPKEHIAARLREVGYEVEVIRFQSRYDLLLDGRIRLALRTAFPALRRSRVRQGTRLYEYRYATWTFNFHHHGHVGRRYCDFFLCIPLVSTDPDLSAAYVIPWEGRGGKTFVIACSTRPYRGKYAQYRNAWEQLRESRGGVGLAIPAPNIPPRSHASGRPLLRYVQLGRAITHRRAVRSAG